MRELRLINNFDMKQNEPLVSVKARDIVSDDICQFSDDEIQKISTLPYLIAADDSGDISIENLASLLHLEPGRLELGCQIVLNKNFTDVTNDLKLERIASELVTKSKPLSEIVYGHGYRCRSYFYQIFKQKFNCDPKDYIRKFQSDTAI